MVEVGRDLRVPSVPPYCSRDNQSRGPGGLRVRVIVRSSRRTHSLPGSLCFPTRTAQHCCLMGPPALRFVPSASILTTEQSLVPHLQPRVGSPSRLLSEPLGTAPGPPLWLPPAAAHDPNPRLRPPAPSSIEQAWHPRAPSSSASTSSSAANRSLKSSSSPGLSISRAAHRSHPASPSFRPPRRSEGLTLIGCGARLSKLRAR